MVQQHRQVSRTVACSCVGRGTHCVGRGQLLISCSRYWQKQMKQHKVCVLEVCCDMVGCWQAMWVLSCCHLVVTEESNGNLVEPLLINTINCYI